MKKALKATLLLFALVLSLSVTADAGSRKNLAKKTVKSAIKSYKNGAIFDDSKYPALSKLVRKYNKHLHYNIKSVKLSKDKTKATVKVRIKYKSLYKASKAAGYDVGIYAYKRALSFKETSDNQIFNYLVKRVKKRAKKYPVQTKTKTISFKLKYDKASRKWNISHIANSAAHALLCDLIKGYTAGINTFAKEFK